MIEKAQKVEGVESVEVNYGTEKAKVSFDPSKKVLRLFQTH